MSYVQYCEKVDCREYNSVKGSTNLTQMDFKKLKITISNEKIKSNATLKFLC
jgi:hypothetical protein